MPRPRHPHWHKRDGCYYTRVDGRQVALRHPDGTKVAHGDARGVREAVDRLMAAHDAGRRRAADPTVLDVCRDYLVALARENTAETMAGKEWVLRMLCAFSAGGAPYGQRPARELGPAELARMRKAWEKEGYGNGTVRRLYREVLACWSWAARPEPERTPVVLLERNPLAGMRLPPGTRGRPKYVPLAMVDRLVAFARERAARMGPRRRRFEAQTILALRLLAESGCRPKEACEARWGEFDAEAGLITLARHKTGKKTGRDRVIVVPPRLAAELAALRASGTAHPEHLFAHVLGGKARPGADRDAGAPWMRAGLSDWFLRLKRQALAAGVEVPAAMTLYWLRHSFQTDAVQALSADAAADLAGNTAAMARGTYHHAQAQYLREMHERVASTRRGGQASSSSSSSSG